MVVLLPNGETPITDLPDRDELVDVLQRALIECDDSALLHHNNSNASSNMRGAPARHQYGRRNSADVFFSPSQVEELEGEGNRRLPPPRQESCKELMNRNNNNKRMGIPRRSSMPLTFGGGLQNPFGGNSKTTFKKSVPQSMTTMDPPQQQQRGVITAADAAAADAGAAAARSFLVEALGSDGPPPAYHRDCASSPLSFLGQQQQAAAQVPHRRSSVGPGPCVGAPHYKNLPVSFELSSASAATQKALSELYQRVDMATTTQQASSQNALNEYHQNVASWSQQQRRLSMPGMEPPHQQEQHLLYERRLSTPFDSYPVNDQAPSSPRPAAAQRRRSSLTSGATAAVRRNSIGGTSKEVKVHKAGQTISSSAQKNKSAAGSGKDGGAGAGATDTGSEKKRTWKKPKDKPRRPLSAYNLFFKSEREVLIKTLEPLPEPVEEPKPEKGRRKRRHRKTHGKISFADLARTIGERWKNLDEAARAPFEAQALKEKERYRIELEAWNKKKLEAAAAAVAAAAAEEQKKEEDLPSDDENEETMKDAALKSEHEDKVKSLSHPERKKRAPRYQPIGSLRLDTSIDTLAMSLQSTDLNDMENTIISQSIFDSEESLPLPRAPAVSGAGAGVASADASENIDQRLAEVLHNEDAEVEKLLAALDPSTGSSIDDALGTNSLDDLMKFDFTGSTTANNDSKSS